MAAAAASTKNGFLEFVELSESYTESSSRPAAAGGWHSPRISFSNEFAQPTEEEDEAGARNSTAGGSSSGGGGAASQGPSAHNPSSSAEFEFNMAAATTQPPVKCPMLSADELFYKGKLLPLHLPPRIRMVQDLSEVEEKQLSRSPALGGMMRRERSLRSPVRPSVVPCTLKSSSYPPPGCSSRPPSPPKAAKYSSRWRDLFGFKKGHQQQQQIPAPKPPIAAASTASSSGRQAAPSRLLKMIFNRGSSNSSSSCSSSEQHPAALGHHETSSSGNEALLPLLRDSSSESSCPVAAEMCHSSSISSTSSFSSSASSNWAASSASSSTASSSSFSVDFPEVCSTSSSSSSTSNKAEGGGAVSCRKPEKLGNNNRSGRGIGSPGRRRGVAGRVALSNKAAAAAPPGGVDARVVVMKNLQRCGSNRKAASSTSMGKLQDHGNNNKPLSMRPHSDSWRRPDKAGGNSNNTNGASYSSSVRVTPVLHVPACIGPSLRSVRVHGFRRLFSSSSSSSSAASGSSKPSTEGVVVM